ncbi:hypothetical protein WMY93_033533, partial [Mugilogobius chulae]
RSSVFFSRPGGLQFIASSAWRPLPPTEQHRGPSGSQTLSSARPGFCRGFQKD